jgi:putative colanic acid biosysnthesis UDP-glucose lipid carrier transferase
VQRVLPSQEPGFSQALDSVVQMRTIAPWSLRLAADIISLSESLAVAGGIALPCAVYFNDGGGADIGWLRSAVLSALIYRQAVPASKIDISRPAAGLCCNKERVATALVLAVFTPTAIGALSDFPLAVVANWFILWLAASYVLLTLVQLGASRAMQGFSDRGRFYERVAVFGAGHLARRVSDQLAKPSASLNFVGIYDSRETPSRVKLTGLRIAGNIHDLIEACRNGHIDRIIIALPQAAEGRIGELRRRFEDLSVSVHIVTHLATDAVALGRQYPLSQLGPVGLIDLKRRHHVDWAPLIKRVIDLLIGVAMAIAIAPLVPIIAIAIKAESRGPVLFRQRRRGRDQHVFNVLKFRTMSVMEDGAEVRQATTHDPRVTSLGRILRRTSIDELPQLWNVLRGDMSLVGPRPHALVHDEKFGQLVESYANRHQMKPGITGLAQVKGFRGETTTIKSVEARVNCDLAYIRGWSVWLDLKILALTVVAVGSAANAK